MNTVTETAVVSRQEIRNGYIAACEDENFTLKFGYYRSKIDEKLYVKLLDCKGVIKLGFLSNTAELYEPYDVADISKRLAIYRLINTAQQMGADGVVEPIISMNMAKSGNLLYYKTTISGKLIKLKVK